MNLWHDIKAGSADSMTTIIEINKGSKNKYEVDKETGMIALDRVLHTAQDYPFDYGFVPQTLWEDGDPLDVVVLTTYPLFPGVLLQVRPVAVLTMIDAGESDAKIIAVPEKDPRWSTVQDLKDINPHTLKEIDHFFLTYKKLQNKEVTTHGFSDAIKAKQDFETSRKAYIEKYPKA